MHDIYKGESHKISMLARYEKVFAVLIKYGFEDLLAHPPFNRILPQTNKLVPERNGKKVSEFTRYERIRLVCEELGTTYIKFAQIASNRPDLLPDGLIIELEKLQDQAPKVPLKDIYQALKDGLHRPLEELVEEFDEEPLARASMAQVHRAKLKGGKDVIIKVQRPGIRDLIHADIAIFRNLVSIIESYLPHYLVYQPAELLKMFEQSINEELSFNLEAKNLKQFQIMFAENHEVFIPKLYPELSSDTIICMEYVDGYKITDLTALRAFNITGEDLALRGIGLYFEQVFDHGFFHADPHPGNIFVLRDGRIAFIDFGMVGTIIESDKVHFAKILLSMYNQDVSGLKSSILKFSEGLTKEEEREFEYDVIYFLRQYSSVSIEDIDGDEVMRGLNALFFDYKIKIPANLLLLLKALIIIEGVGYRLNPDYDIIQNIGPYVNKLLAKRFDPKRITMQMMESFENTTTLVRDFPSDMRSIIKKVKDGKLHIEFEHKGLGPYTDSMATVINRLSFSLIIVALLISSSILIYAETPPFYKGVSLWGCIGIGIAILMALRLLWVIRKSASK